MSTKIYCKNNHIVACDPVTDTKSHSSVRFNGRDVSVQQGRATDGGLLLLNDDELITSRSCHEVVVLASAVRGVSPGDRVIVFLGGDTEGTVSANGISAFVKLDGAERYVIAGEFVWAKVKDGEVLPLGHVVLTERDDEAFRRHTMGAASLLFLPEAQLAHGTKATGEADDRVLSAVTALYERVRRVGADTAGLETGETVCFSPSYCATRLRRRVGGETKYYHLVDSREIYFAVGA